MGIQKIWLSVNTIRKFSLPLHYNLRTLHSQFCQERIIREIEVSGTETTRPSCSYNAKDAIYFILFQIHSQPHTRSDYTREERGERVSIRLSQVSFSFQCRQVLLLTSINSSRPNYILMIIEKVHLLLF